jgi:hypothetical protein
MEAGRTDINALDKIEPDYTNFPCILNYAG